MPALTIWLGGMAIGIGFIPVIAAYAFYGRVTVTARTWIFAGLVGYLYGAGYLAIFWMMDLAREDKLVVLGCMTVTIAIEFLLKAKLWPKGG